MFTDSLKLVVKRRAHFACCLCHSVGVEVHHIVPQAEGGPDAEDNAAPLCPSCHEMYGANPTKRRFIREAREFWYDVCRQRYGGEQEQLAQLHEAMEAVATKDDLNAAMERLMNFVSKPTSGPGTGEPLPPTLVAAGITKESIRAYLRWMYPTLTHCGEQRCRQWEDDLESVGYSTINELHMVLGSTKEAVREFVQDRRDTGENMDRWTDNMPIELFLAVLDQRYCQLRFPRVANRPAEYPWVRRATARN